MYRRTGGKKHHVGTIIQMMVVGVLLLAVFWQIDGSRHEPSPGISSPDSPVSQREGRAEPYITTEEVNLRRGPGVDHEVISVVPLHAEVLVTGNGQNGFMPVEIGGTSAWISDDYLVPEGAVLGGTTGELPVQEAPEPTEVPLPTEPPVFAADVTTDVAPEPTEAPVEDAPPVEETVEADEPVPAEAAPMAATTSALPVEEPGLTLTGEGERWVDVNRTTGTVTLYEGERVVAEFEALVGKDASPDGFYSTAVGTFRVHMKRAELTETPFADGVYLTHFVGFDWERSNGFHSPTKDAQGNVIQTGGTATLGCVRLGDEEARLLFDFAFVGMRVEVHD